jgi:hypothetical protein
MPELTWTTALAWFGVIASGLTVGGLVGSLVCCWLSRRGDRRTHDHPRL